MLIRLTVTTKWCRFAARDGYGAHTDTRRWVVTFVFR